MKKFLHRSRLIMFFLLTFCFLSFSTMSQTQYVKGFGGPSNWYSDDTRNAAGVNLVGVNSTLYGKPGQAPTPADDVAIAAQLQFVAGPANGTYGGAIKIIHPTNNAGKSTLSTVNLSGFAPGSALVGGTFSAQYRWYQDISVSTRTVALRLGIQSTNWAASQLGFTAVRSGEQTWDLILVHTQPPIPTPDAWNLDNIDKDNGKWNLFKQAGNTYYTTPINDPSTAKTLQEWNDDPIWGPRLFGVGALVTSVQFGLGSGQNGGIAYVDYLQTSILNSGNLIDFVCASGNTVQNTNTGEYFCSIQAAIDAPLTVAGNTINVGAGTYNENIVVNKSLTILGPNNLISPNGGVRATEAIITGGLSVDNSASKTLVIEGFYFQGVTSPMVYNGNLAGTIAADLTFRKNLVNNSSGQLAVDLGTATNSAIVVVDDNSFANMSSNAIQFNAGTGTLNATVSNNSITGTVNAGINTSNISTSTFDGNTISNTTQQGIQVTGTASNVTISNNVITNANTSNALDRGGIRLRGGSLTGFVNITNNIISGSNNGIALPAPDDITGKTINVNNNNLSGNTKSINHFGSGNLNATCNWYGTANSAAVASKISGPVTYIPYLTSGGDGAGVGFQPTGNCNGSNVLTISCSQNLNVMPTTLTGSVVNYSMPSVTSNCPGVGAPVLLAGLASGSFFPIGTTTVTYQVTDLCGNTVTCSFTVTVAQLPYCDNKQKKVYMCHNGNTICVSLNAVQAHLNHGDYLGQCTTSRSIVIEEPVTDEFRVNVYPNPSAGAFRIQVISKSMEAVSVKVMDLSGKVLTVNSNVIKGSIVLGNELRPGTYLAEVIQGSSRQVIKLVKVN